MPHPMSETELSTWFERDRSHVCLSFKDGPTIAEWWDEAVQTAVQDGFLDARDWHGSAYRHAAEIGLLEPGAKTPVTFRPDVIGVVLSHPEHGVYCGWRKGGVAIWSSEADDAQAARGAYAFPNREDAEQLAQDDGLEGAEFTDVVLDITEASCPAPRRASFDSCQAAGLDIMRDKATPAPAL